MKSLERIKSKIEELLSIKEYELTQIDILLDQIEEALNRIREIPILHIPEYQDNKTEERLTHYQSYLYTKSESIEENISTLEKECSFIQVSNGIYYLDSKYNYEDLYAFINKYKNLFTLDDLMDVFINVKQIKIQQVIEEAKKEIPQEQPEIPIVESEVVSDDALELAQEFAEEEAEEEEKPEILNDKERIIFFLELLADSNNIEDKKEEFVEEMYNLIQNTNKKCKSFKDSSLYSFFTIKNPNTGTTNTDIYLAYRESNDLDSLKIWISQTIPEYSSTDYCNFEFFDEVIESIKVCDKFVGDYFDLSTLNTRDEITDMYPYLVPCTLTNRELMKNIDFDYVKTQTYAKKTPKHVYKTRKNIVFYTPKAVKSGIDYFDDMQDFVSSLSKNDWDGIFSSYTPNGITSVAGNSYPGFTHSEYQSIAAEYELKDITRVLGSRDTIIAQNRQRMMEYYDASEMEIISIHNIFTGPHNGADGGRRQSIGQYGYTPYYKQIHFYRILSKKEEWTDEEFAYICRVVDYCLKITSDILNGDKDKLSNHSKKLAQVLDSYTPSMEKRGQKS